MERCLVCGAELKPGMDWCGQCYAPRSAPPPNPRGTGGMVGGRYADPRFSPPSAPHDVKYSRFRGGPTSMGAFGRVVTTILLILLACIVYVYVFPVTVGESGPRDVALYALVAVPALIVVLRRVWRAHRIG